MAGTNKAYTRRFSTEFTAESIDVDIVRRTKESWYGGSRYFPEHTIESGFIDYIIKTPYYAFDGVERKGCRKFRLIIEEVD